MLLQSVTVTRTVVVVSGHLTYSCGPVTTYSSWPWCHDDQTESFVAESIIYCSTYSFFRRPRLILWKRIFDRIDDQQGPYSRDSSSVVSGRDIQF